MSLLSLSLSFLHSFFVRVRLRLLVPLPCLISVSYIPIYLSISLSPYSQRLQGSELVDNTSWNCAHGIVIQATEVMNKKKKKAREYGGH